MIRFRSTLVMTAAALAATFLGPSRLAAQEAPTTFKSPQAAVHALVVAVQASDTPQMLTILGPDSKDLISTGDPVADKEGRQRFLHAYKQRATMMRRSDGSVVMRLGAENWPFPIPLVKQGDLWHFDTAAGHEEVLNRRIGANELSAIKVCQAYVEAQREYFAQCPQGDAIVQYAQRFLSEPGKRDGLYWKVAPGQELSPMGPQVAAAEAEGYTPGSNSPGGFHGYKFHILKSQGANAPGGAYDYVINGHMVAGFALAAYPVKHGETGVMTYVVNQNGIIYHKDLGDGAADLIKTLQYDPDETWTKLHSQK